MTSASIAAKRKPALDEGAFQQLLAAAYVLQQHNDALRSKEQQSSSGELLAEIADIQAQVRNRDLDNPSAAQLIADRLRKMTHATGVSVSLISEGFLDCVAESGAPANLPGSSLASHSLIATERLKNGEMFESAEAQTDIRLDVALCRESNVGSLVAVPVLRFGEIAGLIEARWDRAKGFDEAAKRACGLMAGLTTGTLERRAQRDKQATSISPIFPELAVSSDLREITKVNATDEPEKKVLDVSALAEFCRVCGSAFAADEAFCGQCSMPRVAAPASDALQSKWASLWYMQKAQDTRKHSSAPKPIGSLAKTNTQALAPSESKATSHMEPPVQPATKKSEIADWAVKPTHPVTPKSEVQIKAAEPLDNAAPAQSAFRLGAALSSEPLPRLASELPAEKRHVVPRFSGRDMSLIAGSLCVVLVLAVWAFSSSGAPGQHWITSMLVRIGVAEVPGKEPVYAGRADAPVWKDVHTSLYYCEGSSMYGKTPEGSFTTQHKAQHDHFESATGLVCP